MNKEELLKAIEQKRQEIWPTDTGEMAPANVPNNIEQGWIQGWLNALKWMKDFINFLPAEQQSEDMEKFIQDLIDKYPVNKESVPNDSLNDYYQGLRFGVLQGAQWQKEQIMKSAVDGVMDCDDSNEWVEITDRFVVTPSRAGKKVKAILFMEDEQLNNKVNVEPPSFEESQGEVYNSYNVALNG